MVTVYFNSFTNPLKSDNEKRLIHVCPQVYMSIKLIYKDELQTRTILPYHR